MKNKFISLDVAAFAGRMSAMEAERSHMATKEDVKALKSELIDRISKLEGLVKAWLVAVSALLLLVNAVIAALVKGM